MKVFLQVAAFVACSVSSAVVLAEAAPDTNRFQIGSFTENGVTFHGEVVCCPFLLTLLARVSTLDSILTEAVTL